MTLGARIVEARSGLGWSRQDLANAAGVPYPTLAGLENGDQKTSTAIPALASALGVHALWLAEGKGAKNFLESSQLARFDDATMEQAVELLYLMADARPDDVRFRRFTWGMIQVAAKGINAAKGDPRNAIPLILKELALEA